jgi:hypothetical protein
MGVPLHFHPVFIFLSLVEKNPLNFFQLGGFSLMGRLHPMRRVIRHTGTGKFFKNDDWTRDFNEAANFHSISEAVRACRGRHRLAVNTLTEGHR